MSDSVRPHRRQPTRLPCPWDSPGKNTGVDCHCLLQCMKVKSESEVAQLCPTPSNPMDCSLPGSSVHGIFQARVLEWGAIAFSIHPIRTNSNAFFFMSEQYSIVCMYPSFFIHSSVKGHIDCLHVLCMLAKSLQSCPTLCDPIDGSPPGSPVPGILLARTLVWVAISFSNA